MARNLTSDQRDLLRAPELAARILTTWWMDDGVHRFCDDVYDLTYSGDTWIGANAIASATEIRSSTSGFAAESVTLTIDGTRLSQAGLDDPAAFFQSILELPLTNRRVDIELGLMPVDQVNPTLVLPLYAGKINYPRLVDGSRDMMSGEPVGTKLEMVLDSLAARYQWVVGRTRSHADQQEIDPTDLFFQFVGDNIRAEQTLYWGKKGPEGIVSNAGITSTRNGYYNGLGPIRND